MEKTIHFGLRTFDSLRESFLFICRKLNDTLKRKDTRFRKSITVEKRLAICFWHLATGEDLRSLGWRFGIGKSTACQIVNEVCQAIVDVLLPDVIKWPSGDDLKKVVESFKTKWCFPQFLNVSPLFGTGLSLAGNQELTFPC